MTKIGNSKQKLDADFAGYAEGFYRSILVYAYILMYCFKNQGFLSEGFESGVF
jgi:hypothetical protein